MALHTLVATILHCVYYCCIPHYSVTDMFFPAYINIMLITIDCVMYSSCVADFVVNRLLYHFVVIVYNYTLVISG